RVAEIKGRAVHDAGDVTCRMASGIAETGRPLAGAGRSRPGSKNRAAGLGCRVAVSGKPLTKTQTTADRGTPDRPGLGIGLAFPAFAQIPLAAAYAIAFLTPLGVTALAAPGLGERVGWRQWLAVGIGFAAVIAILRPDFGAVGFGQLAMIASAALFVINMLM